MAVILGKISVNKVETFISFLRDKTLRTYFVRRKLPLPLIFLYINIFINENITIDKLSKNNCINGRFSIFIVLVGINELIVKIFPKQNKCRRLSRRLWCGWLHTIRISHIRFVNIWKWIGKRNKIETTKWLNALRD